MANQAFYRSRWTRCSFAVTGAFLTWAFTPWAPTSVRAAPSLRWLHEALPWTLLWVAFAVYTVLQVLGLLAGVILADFLGAFLYLIEVVALLATAGQEVNGQYVSIGPWALAAFTLAVALHVAAGRLALYERESRRGGP